MSTPAPPSVVEAFCADGTVNVDYTIIPVPSQVGVSPELASFATGFPPATRTPRNQGGIPPRGLDMNGILFMLSAHVAWLASGNGYTFNPDVAAVAGGYNVGATVRSAVNALVGFRNTVPNNVNDPDVDPTGWVSFPVEAALELQTETLAAGTVDVMLDPDTGFLDITPDPTGSSIENITGGYNGQVLSVTNVTADSLVLLASGNLRLPLDLTVIQNDTVSFRFSSTLAKWVKL